MKIRQFNPWVGFVISVILVALVFNIQSSKRAASVAAIGAVIAVIGVVTLWRPIIRLGYKDWLHRSSIIDSGEFSQDSVQIEEMRQQSLDAQAVQLSGPLLIVFGTLLNGFSGFVD